MVLLSLFHCHHGIVSLYSLPQDAESPQYNLDTNALDGENRVCDTYMKVSTNVTDDHLGFGKDIAFIFRGLHIFWILGYSCGNTCRCTFHNPSREKFF